MDRTESPTESRLEALRKEGIIPFSRFVVRAAVIIATLFAAWYLLSGLRGNLVDALNGAQLDRSFMLTQVRSGLKSNVILVVIPALAAVFVGGLFTRFWFSASVSRRMHQVDSQRIFAVFMRVLLATLIFGYLGFSLLPFFWSLVSGASSSVSSVVDMVKLTIFVTSGFVFIGAVLSFILVRIEFIRRHRMTKREVLRD